VIRTALKPGVPEVLPARGFARFDRFCARPLLPCLAFLLVSACGGARKGPDENDRLSVDRLYPLRVGAVWSYDVDTGQGLPILAITRVTKASENAAEIMVGKAPIAYERRPEGLYRPDREAFVLQAPVRTGEKWDAGDGATAEVMSVAKTVQTPAGQFQGCAEIVESGSSNGKVVRTVFCPDVGPVEVESSMPSEGGGEAARVVARLRGFDLSARLAPQ
jgi:hypothetical protein